MSERSVVADSGPLIALATIGQLDVLRSLYSSVLVPDAVTREVVEAGAGRRGAAEVAAATWLQRVRLDSPPDAYLSREFGAGEAEVIALAVQRGKLLVLLDEREARRAAELIYGLEVRGTVGSLAAAKRRGLVSVLRPLLDALQQSGYYISSAIIEGACRDVGE